MPRPCSASVPSDAAGRPMRGHRRVAPVQEGQLLLDRQRRQQVGEPRLERLTGIPERVGVVRRVALAGRRGGRRRGAAGIAEREAARPGGGGRRRYSRAATATPRALPCKPVSGATSRPLVAASVAFMSTTLNAYRRAPCAAFSRPSWALRPSRPRPRAGGGWVARLRALTAPTITAARFARRTLFRVPRTGPRARFPPSDSSSSHLASSSPPLSPCRCSARCAAPRLNLRHDRDG